MQIQKQDIPNKKKLLLQCQQTLDHINCLEMQDTHLELLFIALNTMKSDIRKTKLEHIRKKISVFEIGKLFSHQNNF